MQVHRIREFMTAAPRVIECHQSIAEAVELMRELRVRHLPVVDRGLLVGVLSERDILRMRSGKRASPEVVATGEAMTPEPFTVGPDEPLAAVVRGMAERHHGAAVIVDGANVIGVFTTNDALWVLADFLDNRAR